MIWVCVDRLPKDWVGDTVTADNQKGAHKATRHLIEMGHKHLAAITGPLHLTNAQERLNGFKQAVKEAKLQPAPEYVQETTFDKQGARQKLRCYCGSFRGRPQSSPAMI